MDDRSFSHCEPRLPAVVVCPGGGVLNTPGVARSAVSLAESIGLGPLRTCCGCRLRGRLGCYVLRSCRMAVITSGVRNLSNRHGFGLALAAAVLALAGAIWFVVGRSEPSGSWTDWPLGAEFVGVEVVLDGKPLTPAQAGTLSFTRFTPSQVSLSAFGCFYGAGKIVVEDGRLLEADLIAPASECIVTDEYSFVSRELYSGQLTISFEQGQLLFESARMKLVLETTEDEIVPAIPYEQEFIGTSSSVPGVDVGSIRLVSPALTVLSLQLDTCEVHGGYTEAENGLAVGGFSEERIPIDCPKATKNDREIVEFLASNPTLALDEDRITLTNELGWMTFTER